MGKCRWAAKYEATNLACPYAVLGKVQFGCLTSHFIHTGSWTKKFQSNNTLYGMGVISIVWSHDDVIKWKHFPRNWSFVRGIHRSPVNYPHKGQWRGALMFSLICVWINDSVKHWWGWWFETLSCPLWRHSNVFVDFVLICNCCAIWYFVCC